jgi:hypothetical protein
LRPRCVFGRARWVPSSASVRGSRTSIRNLVGLDIGQSNDAELATTVSEATANALGAVQARVQQQ